MTFQILEPITVPIDQVHENQWNPNVMDDETLRLTRLSFEEEGFSDPIDVAPCQEHADYVILDGEHRWKIAKEIGYTQIPVFVKDRHGDDAKITTIRKDRTHGEPDLIKMAGIVGELVDELGPDEVHRRLGYDQDEQQSMLELTRWSYDVYDTVSQDAIDEAKNESVLWSISLSQETFDTLTAVLPEFAEVAKAGPHGDTEVGRFVAFIEEALNRA